MTPQQYLYGNVIVDAYYVILTPCVEHLLVDPFAGGPGLAPVQENALHTGQVRFLRGCLSFLRGGRLVGGECDA